MPYIEHKPSKLEEFICIRLPWKYGSTGLKSFINNIYVALLAQSRSWLTRNLSVPGSHAEIALSTFAHIYMSGKPLVNNGKTRDQSREFHNESRCVLLDGVPSVCSS